MSNKNNLVHARTCVKLLDIILFLKPNTANRFLKIKSNLDLKKFYTK